MTDRLIPAMVAILLGAVIGVLVFIPFVARQYRRQGRLTLRQLLLWACFLVYGLALWTYTLLPLPTPDDIRCVTAQLRPFQFVDDILDEGGITSVADVVRNPAVMQVALNVALFVPLGFFLRLVWRRGAVVATIVGLALSLAIETTQLTGVWGVYPCSYRLFDVDDLLANGAGALLGGLTSAALGPWLDRDHPGAAALRPQPVTFWRRTLGMVCDVLGMWLAGGLVGVVVNVWQLWVIGLEPVQLDPLPATIASSAVPLVGFAVLTLVTGRTLGDHAVLLRWQGGVGPVWLTRSLRYLAGIGGWQLLVTLGSTLDGLFALISIIVLITTRRRGGLPGLASRQIPVDARTPADRTPPGSSA